MLAGLQTRSPLDPKLGFELFSQGAAPSYDDIVEGRDLVKYDKVPVRVSGYKVEVFDMMDPEARAQYSDLMKRLVEGIQTSKVVIYRNDLQVMQSAGDSKWFRYVEYAEYELNDPILSRTRTPQQGGGGGGGGGGSNGESVSVPSGVIQNVGEV